MSLDIQGIGKRFGGLVAVDNFSLHAEKGEIHGIIGPNGAGKTTIFNLISGVYASDTGSIVLDAQELTRLPQHIITRCGIGRTFQNIRLFKGLSVIDNVMCAFDPSSRYGFLSAIFPTQRRFAEEKRGREICEHFLDVVGLSDYRNEMPENLAYGLQRRLEIARALTCKPTVLLLDEPAAGLNPTEVSDLTCLIQRLSEELGFAILLIEHRLELVMRISHIIHVQNFGKTIATGTPSQVKCDPEVIKAYLGEEESHAASPRTHA